MTDEDNSMNLKNVFLHLSTPIFDCQLHTKNPSFGVRVVGQCSNANYSNNSNLFYESVSEFYGVVKPLMSNETLVVPQKVKRSDPVLIKRVSVVN